MDKYGVATDFEKVGKSENTKTKRERELCPVCGATLVADTGVMLCPKCGTKPFEQ